ncbi:MAG: LLM class flavin-dependent oxidoreductase [Nitrospinae bacterium]|nr:LLM class flavin-dependent oxidoreductase [Nitrospinota bacterium]
MNVGFFLMPSHPPERGLFEAHQWDLDFLALVDELGFEEAWIGEHFTSPWEPIPAPDLLIAQALLRTKRIKLGVGAHLLPFHHPAELAHRVAYLDHLAQGRFLFGIGASGLPSDWALFNVDGQAGQHREMTREALDIILKLWENRGPLEYKGKFWSVNVGDTMYGTLKFHITPFQKPYPPIGVASVSIRSPTLIIAGERGFIPMSLGLNAAYLASHWEAVEEGANRTGLTPSRKIWRIVRDVYVADTDAEAREAALHGMMGRVWREYLLPLFDAFQLLSVFKHDPNVPDRDVTPEYLLEHLWLVGSPKTVTEKLHQLYEAAGGFGTLLVLVYDHRESQAGWEKSTRLLAHQVLPNIANLSPP